MQFHPSRGVLLLALLMLAGCGQSTPTPAKGKLSTVPTTTGPAAATTPTTKATPKADPAAVQDAVAAAKTILASLRVGIPEPAAFTPDFKKLIGPPATAADQKNGFSDWAAEQWLKSFQGKVAAENVTGVDLAPAVLVTSAPPENVVSVGRAVLRMVKVGDRWQADWLHVGPAGNPVSLAEASPDLSARFVAAAFIETVLAGEMALAESLLTPALRARLAPPLGAADTLGFNRTLLINTLNNFRESATGYENLQIRITGDKATAQGHLIADKSPRPFELTLTRDGPTWKVDELTKK